MMHGGRRLPLQICKLRNRFTLIQLSSAISFKPSKLFRITYYNKYHHFYASDIVSSCLTNSVIYRCCLTSDDKEVRFEKGKSAAQMVALAGFQVIVSMLYRYKTLAFYVLLISL